MSNKVMILLVPLVLVLISTSYGEDGDYFPLKEGLQWEYESIDSVKSRMTSTVLPKRNLNGQEVSVVRLVFPTESSPAGDPSFMFFLKSNLGIKMIAEQDSKDAEPRLRKQDDFELKFPLTVGSSWISYEELGEGMDKFTFPVNKTIEKMDEVVTVEAGTFEGCMRVTGKFKGKVNLGSYGGAPELTYEDYTLHAPGVGIVKLCLQYEFKLETSQACAQLKSFIK